MSSPNPLDEQESSQTITAAESIPDRQLEEYTHGANFAWVTLTLMAHRDDILARWLDAVSQQPFHFNRKEHAVADHIPELFDALTALLHSTAPRWVDAYAPLEDKNVLAAAQSHAQARASQGLRAADVAVEFRLLRQEIWRALRTSVPNGAPTDDIVAAEMLVNDALDGAVSQGLAALGSHIEQVREEFLAVTLHDVRQPLTAISGEAQLLLRYLAKAEPEVEKARAAGLRIQASVARMVSLLDGLSDTSKVALGSLDLQPRWVNLADIVQKALTHFEPSATSRITFNTDRVRDTTGQWDPARLEQVVANLIGNAIKYSVAPAPIEIQLRREAESVLLTIKDHGIGIAPEDIRRIFSRYARSSNAVEHGAHGLGLGLFLCRGIVEAHGGRIWAESPGLGQGTTVTVILPTIYQDISPTP